MKTHTHTHSSSVFLHKYEHSNKDSLAQIHRTMWQLAINTRGGNWQKCDDSIVLRYLGHASILLRFLTYCDTASIAIRFCDILRFMSPILFRRHYKKCGK